MVGSRKRNIRAGASTQKSFDVIIGMGKRLETMEVNGNVFFPCKICNRLFRKEVEAMGHFQACERQDFRTPREVNPRDETIKNNYIQNEENTKCRRNSERLRRKVNEAKPEQIKNKVKSCNNNVSVPKKRSIKNNLPIVASPRRRGKKLTEQEIAERLRIISEKLKKKVEVKVPFEDEEEEERREIEDKLTALNKDSEISYFDDYPDFDDRLRETDDTFAYESKDSVGGTLVEDQRSGGNCENSGSNPLISNGLGHLNSSGASTGPIIITQRPDGQLHGCRSCPEVFVSELELLRHKRAKHTAPKIIMAPSEIKKFYDVKDKSQCPVCKKILPSSNKSIYIKHLQCHTYVGEFECPVCKKKFKRKDHMRMHQKRHIILC